MRENPLRRRARAVWISDLHLGTRACRADFLLEFLRCVETDRLYLVGDILDMWRLKSGWHWPQSHNDVVDELISLARRGTRVIYVPGNHDEGFRRHDGLHFGGIEVRRDVVHTLSDGRRLLVFHGDELDFVVREHPWLAHLGDHVYDFLVFANRAVNWCRTRLGLGYWSLSGYLKDKTKNAVQVIGNFEQAVAAYVRSRGCDGAVCGHIHKAEIRLIDGVLYCNDGDWVESCTALVEQRSGKLELIDWPSLRGAPQLDPAAAPVAEPEPAAV